LPPNFAAAGHRVCSLHGKASASGRVHAGGKRRPPLPSGIRIPAPRQSPGASGQPALPHDARAPETARFLHFCHCRSAGFHFEPTQEKIRQEESPQSLEEELDNDYEALDETADEWPAEDAAEPLSDADRAALQEEIAELDEFATLAISIEQNAKGKALVKALAVAFKKAAEFGAAEKAIIFTESRRTQNYLLRVLADSPFKDGIVLFNGSNNDDRSKAIYAAWGEKHAGSDRVSGSKTADMRSALVDYFREEGRIMIATEAGAEGINLQFCSLVVNYDLPWIRKGSSNASAAATATAKSTMLWW
jgi:hypothetical protein